MSGWWSLKEEKSGSGAPPPPTQHTRCAFAHAHTSLRHSAACLTPLIIPHPPLPPHSTRTGKFIGSEAAPSAAFVAKLEAEGGIVAAKSMARAPLNLTGKAAAAPGGGGAAAGDGGSNKSAAQKLREQLAAKRPAAGGANGANGEGTAAAKEAAAAGDAAQPAPKRARTASAEDVKGAAAAPADAAGAADADAEGNGAGAGGGGGSGAASMSTAGGASTVADEEVLDVIAGDAVIEDDDDDDGADGDGAAAMDAAAGGAEGGGGAAADGGARALTAAELAAAHADFKEQVEESMKAKGDRFEESVAAEAKIRLGEAGWRARYYEEKMGAAPGAAQSEVIAGVVKAYIEGLVWVMRYYYDGVASWNW